MKHRRNHDPRASTPRTTPTLLPQPSSELRAPSKDLILGRVPGQAFLVEFDDDLRALLVRFLARNEVGVFGTAPLHQEHELARGVSSSDDLLRREATFETLLLGRLVGGVRGLTFAAGALLFVFFLLLLGRPRRGFRLLRGLGTGLRLRFFLLFVLLLRPSVLLGVESVQEVLQK